MNAGGDVVQAINTIPNGTTNNYCSRNGVGRGLLERGWVGGRFPGFSFFWVIDRMIDAADFFSI